MNSFQEMIGLSVIELPTGTCLGHVRDILLDKQWSFFGILLEPKGLLRSGKYVPSGAIHAVGEDCVTVLSESNVLPLPEEDDHEIIMMFTGSGQMKGRPAISASGYQLGQLEDVYFQEETGTIIGYELSDGFLADIMEGRKMIPSSVQPFIGKDALIFGEPICCKLPAQHAKHAQHAQHARRKGPQGEFKEEE